jgi:hypothetical protein
MCKIFLVAGIKPTTQEKVWRFAEAIGKPMSKTNSDGLGYGAITSDGKLFGERWLSNDTAFQNEVSEDVTGLNYEGAVVVKVKDKYEYNSYGEIDKANVTAITMHTRWATSPKGMMNTHPFVLDGVSLIHNGVIRNDSEFKLKSTCDSEAILQAYVTQKVWESPDNFQAAADMLRGYYACGVLVNTTEGPFLDIFKAHGASLYVTYVKELETWVHSTSDSDIKDTCKEFGYSHGPMYSILPNKFIRINAITGKKISIADFTPGTDTYHNTYYNHPTQSRTYQSGRNGRKEDIQTANIGGDKLLGTKSNEINRNNILPYGKKKSNTTISPELISYYSSGRMSCVPLTDREIQEEIMNTERSMGRY